MPPRNGSYYTDNEFGYSDPELARQLNVAEGRVAGTIYPWGTVYADGGSPSTVSGVTISQAPVPLAAKSAFTGVPKGADMQNLVNNPLADPNAPITANLDLCGWATPGSTAWKICKGVIDTVGGSGSTPGTIPLGTQTCPTGYHKDANGKCAQDGISTYIPGDVGKPDYVWTPVNGRFGQGVTPVRVAVQKRACPPGMVLGKDGVCYDRLARTNRAHNPGAKPLLTGGDMNALRKAKSLEKRWRKVAGAFHKKVVPAGARMVKRPRGK